MICFGVLFMVCLTVLIRQNPCFFFRFCWHPALAGELCMHTQWISRLVPHCTCAICLIEFVHQGFQKSFVSWSLQSFSRWNNMCSVKKTWSINSQEKIWKMVQQCPSYSKVSPTIVNKMQLQHASTWLNQFTGTQSWTARLFRNHANFGAGGSSDELRVSMFIPGHWEFFWFQMIFLEEKLFFLLDWFGLSS